MLSFGADPITIGIMYFNRIIPDQAARLIALIRSLMRRLETKGRVWSVSHWRIRLSSICTH